MLEDYNIIDFTKIQKYVQQKNKGLEPLLVHLSSSPIPTFPGLTCTQQLLTKAGVKSEML